MLKFNKAKRKAEKEMMEQAAGPNYSQSLHPIYTQLPPQSAASKGGLGDR
jgi:hypothetical protein